MTPDIKSRINELTPDAGLQHIPAKAGQAEEFHPLVRRSDMHAAIEAVTGSEMSHTNPLPEQALLAARRFIKNGVALGYIRMPDADCPDPAHDTLPLIERALEAYDLGARSTAAQPGEQPSTMHDTTGTQALWPQMIAALAAIDAELGLPEDGCNSLTQTLAAIRKLKAAPPAASGDSTPPSATVQGDPSGALRPEPEAVGQDRGTP